MRLKPLIRGMKIIMTDRNFERELCYSYYRDMENGNDIETICYPSLIAIITELHERIEALENSKTDVYKDFANALKQAGRETLGL